MAVRFCRPLLKVLAVAIGLASSSKCHLMNAQSFAERTSSTELPSATDQEPGDESACLSFRLDQNLEARWVGSKFVKAAKTERWEAAAQSAQKLKALYPQNGI